MNQQGNGGGIKRAAAVKPSQGARGNRSLASFRGRLKSDVHTKGRVAYATQPRRLQ